MTGLMEKQAKEEVTELLKDFYEHATGVRDYGCDRCILIRDQIVALVAPQAKKKHTITQVANKIRVSSKTIARWEQSGRIPKAKRDYRGWRMYYNQDIKKIREIRNNVR